MNKLTLTIYLQEGIVIVDTPGIGGGGKMSKYAERYLSKSYVLSIRLSVFLYSNIELSMNKLTLTIYLQEGIVIVDTTGIGGGGKMSKYAERYLSKSYVLSIRLSVFLYSNIELSMNKLTLTIYLQEGIVIVDTPGIGGGGKMSKYAERYLSKSYVLSIRLSVFLYSNIELSMNKLTLTIYLQEGIVIVDTPGIGGGGKMSKYAERYLSKSYGFIYVINSANAGGVQKGRVRNEPRHVISNNVTF